jgi:chromosome segregation ATPase
MANKTKAEMANEIKELQETVRCGDELIGKQASKIKQLRVLWRDTDIESVEKGCKIKELHDENENLSLIIDRKRNDYNDLNEMRNGAVQRSAEKTKEIKELKADLEFANTAHRDKDIEIKELRDSVRQRDSLITVKDKKNGQLRVLLNGADQVIDENAKEISKLDKAVAELGRLIGEKDSEIKLLREQAVVDAETVREKDNEINNLRADYDNRQAVITEMRNEIKDLKVALASADKANDTRKFHNATVAMGNPLYFQGV